MAENSSNFERIDILTDYASVPGLVTSVEIVPFDFNYGSAHGIEQLFIQENSTHVIVHKLPGFEGFLKDYFRQNHPDPAKFDPIFLRVAPRLPRLYNRIYDLSQPNARQNISRDKYTKNRLYQSMFYQALAAQAKEHEPDFDLSELYDYEQAEFTKIDTVDAGKLSIKDMVFDVPHNPETKSGFAPVILKFMDGEVKIHGTSNLFFVWEAYQDLKEGIAPPDPKDERDPFHLAAWRLALEEHQQIQQVLSSVSEKYKGNEAELHKIRRNHQTERLKKDLPYVVASMSIAEMAQAVGELPMEEQQRRRSQAKKAREGSIDFGRGDRMDRTEERARRLNASSQLLDAMIEVASETGIEFDPTKWCT